MFKVVLRLLLLLLLDLGSVKAQEREGDLENRGGVEPRASRKREETKRKEKEMERDDRASPANRKPVLSEQVGVLPLHMPGCAVLWVLAER